MSPHRWGRLVLLPRILPDGRREREIPPLRCPMNHVVPPTGLRSGDAFTFCACGVCLWYAAGLSFTDHGTGDVRPFRVEYETSPEELAWMEREGFTLERVLDHFASHPVSRPRRSA